MSVTLCVTLIHDTVIFQNCQISVNKFEQVPLKLHINNGIA